MRFIGPLFLLCLIFLQSGFSYYFSFQILSLLILAFLVVSLGFEFRLGISSISLFFVFVFFVVLTALYEPRVISANSTNPIFTTLAILFYAVAIYAFTLVDIKRPVRLLVFLKSISAQVLLVLTVLLIISESGVIPFLNRAAFTAQNAGLIDNATSTLELASNLYYRNIGGVDLFYGETSYLAIVVFVCTGCFILSTLALLRFDEKYSINHEKYISIIPSSWPPYLGIFVLICLSSLSAIMYAVITFYFLMAYKSAHKKNKIKALAIWVFAGLVFLIFSYDYFVYRVTMQQSLSFYQRFGFLFELQWLDIIIGIKEASRLPQTGVHNGIIYIIMIAGIGGICYVWRLAHFVHKVGGGVGLKAFPILLILAVFSQNGGIFSPSKVTLMALVLLPIAASRNVFKTNSFVKEFRKKIE